MLFDDVTVLVGNLFLKFLDTLVDLPLNPSVTYHTIVGNQGKQVPLENSSDGVVPYLSAHVDGAASEVVVPSGHSATGHPRTVEEIRRILYLHLGKRPGTR